MTGDAGGLLKDERALLGISLVFGQGLAVGGDEGGSVALGLSEKFEGEGLDLLVGGATVAPANHGGHQSGTDLARLHFFHEDESGGRACADEIEGLGAGGGC